MSDLSPYEEGLAIDLATAQARIEELEAKLAGAVEALESLADCVDDGCFCSEIQMAAAMDAARTTLAKLTGGKDE